MKSALLEAEDFEEAIEYCHSRGWTDGLPVIPATPDRVERMLAAVDLPADSEIGFYPMRNRPVTLEKMAINAVMAGCRPEHFPVVLALTQCLLDPRLNLHVTSSTTGGCALGFIVNGPVRQALKMNCYGNVLGPGNRATSSIGRALRFIQVNIMGSVGGAGGTPEHGRPILDRGTIGNPARYACFHVVENEEDFPSLTPLHVMRGFEPGDSVVSAFGMFGHITLSNHAEQTPQEWIDTVAHHIVGAGRLFEDGFGILIVPPEPAEMFVANGWSKADIARALWESGRRSTAWVKRNGWKIGGRDHRGAPVEPGDEERMIGVAGSPEEISVVVSGGRAGNFPVWVQNYAGRTFEVVSRRVPAYSGGAGGPSWS